MVAFTIAATGDAARAASVVLPADGATVSSRPAFVFDFARGYSLIELSRTPDVRTDGASVGAFVDPAVDTDLFIGPSELAPNQLPGLALWSSTSRLSAGPYFWHVKPSPEDDPLTSFPWGPTTTLIVRDEPIVFEGWTLKKRRVSARACAALNKKRSRAARYRYAYDLSGRFAWSDNAEFPSGRWELTLNNGPRRIRITGGLSSIGTFAGAICTNQRRAVVTPTLVDSAGQRSPGAPRELTLRG